MQFSVIDQILAWEPGGWIRTQKHLHPGEPYLPDHFPGTPVMPGVLLLEAMAQAGDWLVQRSQGKPPGRFRWQLLRAVKFMRFIRPGETVVITAKLIEQSAAHAELACQAAVEDQSVASARMTLAPRDVCADRENNGAGETTNVFEGGSFLVDQSGEQDCEGLSAEELRAGAPDAAQAFRWLWLDRFVQFDARHSATALRHVPSVRRRYGPGCVFPEQLTTSLVLEGLAQTGGLLAFDAIGFRMSPIMAKITKAEFHGEPEPGAVLDYSAALERWDEDGAAVRVTSRAAGRLHGQAEILFAFMGSGNGGATVAPGVFYTMLCDTGAFDAPSQAEVQPVCQPQPTCG